jgi:hypothetical protein
VGAGTVPPTALTVSMVASSTVSGSLIRGFTVGHESASLVVQPALQ